MLKCKLWIDFFSSFIFASGIESFRRSDLAHEPTIYMKHSCTATRARSKYESHKVNVLKNLAVTNLHEC